MRWRRPARASGTGTCARNLVTHNAKWGELFGFAPEELQHPIEVFADLLHDDDREDVQRALQDALNGSGTYQHEHRMRHRDGTVFHVFDRGQVVECDEAGNPTRMAGAVSDITDRVHAEHRLRVTTEALIDANISLERKVEERTAELERANENLRNLAWRDSLTGLPNRLAGHGPPRGGVRPPEPQRGGVVRADARRRPASSRSTTPTATASAMTCSGTSRR